MEKKLKKEEKEKKWEKVRTKNKCLSEGLFLTVNYNTINEEDRLTSSILLMTSLRGLKVP